MGSLRLSGVGAWLLWCFVHIFFLIGFRNRFRVLSEWIWYYLTFKAGARLIYSGQRDSDDSQGVANCRTRRVWLVIDSHLRSGHRGDERVLGRVSTSAFTVSHGQLLRDEHEPVYNAPELLELGGVVRWERFEEPKLRIGADALSGTIASRIVAIGLAW